MAGRGRGRMVPRLVLAADAEGEEGDNGEAQQQEESPIPSFSGTVRGRGRGQGLTHDPLDPQLEEADRNEPLQVSEVAPSVSRGIRGRGRYLAPRTGGVIREASEGSILGRSDVAPNEEMILQAEPAGGRGRGDPPQQQDRSIISQDQPSSGDGTGGSALLASSLAQVSLGSGNASGPSGESIRTPTNGPGTSTVGVAADSVAGAKESASLVAAAATKDVETKTSRLQRLAEMKKAFQTRRGEKGVRFDATANFLRLEVGEAMGMFEYYVTFNPLIDNISMRKKLVFSSEEVFRGPRSFDGTKLVLPFRLSADETTYQVIHPVHGENITIGVKFIKETESDDAAQFYNVLLRRAMHLTGLKEVNRNYYAPVDVANMKAHKLEIWAGYDTAVSNYEGGLMVCVETIHRVLRTSTVLDSLKSYQQSKRPDWKEKFRESIIGKSVLTRYNNMFYKITDIDWESTPKCSFQRKGEPTTFLKYFEVQHGAKITSENQPMLVSRNKARKNDPDAEAQVVLLVPELTFLTGMSDDITSNFTIMRDLIGQTRISPMQRSKHIQEFLNRFRSCEVASELLRSWGLIIKEKTIQLQGRVMQVPTIIFNNKCTKPAPPENDFTRQVTSGHCYKPIHMGRWLIFMPQNERDKVAKMIDAYKQIAPQLGINYRSPEIIPVLPAGRVLTPSDYSKALIEKANPDEVQFVVIIFSVQRDDLYATVKRQLVVQTCIPSQVILAKTLSNEKRLRSVMQKVVLQINCKLGGALWGLQIPLKDRIMLIGIDSYHDPKRKLNSVFAMVASTDNECANYVNHCRFQAPHQETGDIAGNLVHLCLSGYFEANNTYPTRIVIFRDGVGDGQLEIVKEHEIPPIRDVIEKTCPKGVKFAFVIVQKRVNERIFKVTRGTVLENPDPGSVIDHTITRLGTYDFFLISQLVRQGTVGPTHYVVMDDLDENKPDLIQKLAFSLTYMYFNWPGTIRVPAICQYAHKLAYLAGQHLLTTPHKGTQSKLFFL